MIQVYRSGAELAAFAVLNGNEIAVYRIGPMPVQAGQIVTLNVQCEVTNPYQFPVGVGRAIECWPTGALSRPCMDNVTPAQHHLVLTHHAVEVIAADRPDQYWIFGLWAVAQGQSGSLIVENGYGELTAQIYTPEASVQAPAAPCDCANKWAALKSAAGSF